MTSLRKRFLAIEVEPPGVDLVRRLAPWSGALLVLIVVAACWFVWRASFPMEITYNEPWNAWLTDLATQRGALYPPRDALILNNYPPLSFLLLHVVAALPVFPNALYAGRAVSLVSLFAAAAAVYGISRNLGAGKAPAAFATLWFVAIAFQFFDENVATCDQNLLGLAAMYGAFYLFLRAKTNAGVLAALFGMALAGLIKHNLAAAPLAALVYLFTIRPRFASFAAAFAALVGVALVLICWGVYGDTFFAQVLAPREIVWHKPVISLLHLDWYGPIWSCWLYWLTIAEDGRAKRITPIMILASLSTWLVWRLGSGVGVNAQLELIVATAIAAAVTLEGLTDRRLRLGRWTAPLVSLYAWLLVALAWFSLQDLNYVAALAPGRIAAVNAAADVTLAEVARIASIPGDVACSVRTVCYLAGKPYLFDPYGIGQLLKTGRATPAEIEAKASGIRFESVSGAAHW